MADALVIHQFKSTPWDLNGFFKPTGDLYRLVMAICRRLRLAIIADANIVPGMMIGAVKG